jgi:hypothetical protein
MHLIYIPTNAPPSLSHKQPPFWISHTDMSNPQTPAVPGPNPCTSPRRQCQQQRSNRTTRDSAPRHLPDQQDAHSTHDPLTSTIADSTGSRRLGAAAAAAFNETPQRRLSPPGPRSASSVPRSKASPPRNRGAHVIDPSHESCPLSQTLSGSRVCCSRDARSHDTPKATPTRDSPPVTTPLPPTLSG